MQTQDLRPLHMLCYEAYPFEQFQTQFEQWCRWQQDGRCHWLVAHVASVPVGNGQLFIYPHVAEIANLYVTAVWRRQGLGTCLLNQLTAIAQQHHVPHLEIRVTVPNTQALALYLRSGFVEKDRRYLADKETIITLTKPLK